MQIFEKHAIGQWRETFSDPVIYRRGQSREVREMEPHGQITDNIEIDYKTSRSIFDEMGQRLQQDLRIEASPLPPYLDRLIDELRKQEKWSPEPTLFRAAVIDDCSARRSRDARPGGLY
jgi:hypothetical protein